MRASMVNIATSEKALELCWHHVRFLRLLVGEGGIETNCTQFSFIVLIIYHICNGWVNKVRKLFRLNSYTFQAQYPGTKKY